MSAERKYNFALNKEAEWQLRILQAALEGRTLSIDSLFSSLWLLMIFSIGGLTSSALSGAGLTTTVLLFIALFFSGGLVSLVALFNIGRRQARFKQKLLLLARGRPIGPAMFKDLIKDVS